MADDKKQMDEMARLKKENAEMQALLELDSERKKNAELKARLEVASSPLQKPVSGTFVARFGWYKEGAFYPPGSTITVENEVPAPGWERVDGTPVSTAPTPDAILDQLALTTRNLRPSDRNVV